MWFCFVIQRGFLHCSAARHKASGHSWHTAPCMFTVCLYQKLFASSKEPPAITYINVYRPTYTCIYCAKPTPFLCRFVYNHSTCGRCSPRISILGMQARTMHTRGTCQPLHLQPGLQPGPWQGLCPPGHHPVWWLLLYWLSPSGSHQSAQHAVAAGFLYKLCFIA